MTVLFSKDCNVADEDREFIASKALSIDMWTCSSTNDIYEVSSNLSEGSCLIVDNIQTLCFSIKGLASFLEYAFNKSLRVLSLDGKMDIRRDFNSRLFVDALKLGAEVDGANRSRRTKNALANSKENGKILGRRVGWRKKVVLEVAEPQLPLC